MHRRWVAALCAALVLLTAAASAAAVVISGSFTGVVNESTNAESVFGSPTSLLGQAITGTFRYDTDLLPAMHPISTATSGAWLDAYMPAPFATITHTINGVTRTFYGTYYSELTLAHGNPPLHDLPFRYQSFIFVAADLVPLSAPLLYAAAKMEVGAYDDSVSIVGDPHDPAALAFPLFNPPYASGGGGWSDLDPQTRETVLERAWGFSISSVQAASVPAPGSLALLVLGIVALRLGRAARPRVK